MFGRFFKVSGLLITAFGAVGALCGVGLYFYFAWDLPNIKSVEDYHPPVVSQVFAQDGTPIGEFWQERRLLVPIEKIPPLLIKAFVAAEDSRFYEHHGIDFRGIIRAFWSNLKAHEIVQGGSTITQQVTRALLLSREKSFGRKIKEAVLATRLERFLNKEQILHLYLNQTYFGNRAYGVRAAAENYFHKELDQMNLAEMSILGGLPRAPSVYSPLKNPDLARERQIYVLSRMFETGVITKKEMEEALKTPVALYIAGTDKEQNMEYAPHLMEYLRQLLLQKYGEKALYFGGLKIYTTLDAKLQKAGVASLRKGVEALDQRQGWRGVLEHIDAKDIPVFREKLHKEMLSLLEGNQRNFPPAAKNAPEQKIELQEGQKFRAVVTGFQENDTEIAVGRINGILPVKNLQWARPYNTGVAAYEDVAYVSDPQKILKVGDVIWVKALSESKKFRLFQEPQVEGALFSMEPSSGFVRAMVGSYDFAKNEFNHVTQAMRQPGSSFKPFVYAAALDKGYTFRTVVDDSPIVLQVNPTETWRPENYEGKFNGPTFFHDCLVHSRNVPTVKIARDIGTHYIAGYARKMGLTSPIFKYLSMALGANDVYLHEMVAAYSVYPNLGVYRKPTYVTKIEDDAGTVLETGPIDLTNPVAALPAAENITLDLKTLKEDELNTPLFLKNQPIIQKEPLELSPYELKILYGANIPAGHVMTPKTAYLMTQLLSDVVLHGTGWKVRELKRPVAGKTGTTNDETDAWFIGFTPTLAAGVWIGFDDPAKKIGKKEAGGRTAAPIFLDYMKAATEGQEVAEFPIPEGLEKRDAWSMTGGSALFAEHAPLPDTPGAATLDRSVEFFEQDMEGLPSKTPSAPSVAPPQPKSDEAEPLPDEKTDPGF